MHPPAGCVVSTRTGACVVGIGLVVDADGEAGSAELQALRARVAATAPAKMRKTDARGASARP